MSQKKRGIPELRLDYASFADLVEGSRKLSDLYDDLQAVMQLKELNL